jgi:hypothetical protein
LRDAPREDRTEAVQAFPQLLLTLKDAATRKVRDVGMAAAEAGALVAQLQQNPEGIEVNS